MSLLYCPVPTWLKPVGMNSKCFEFIYGRHQVRAEVLIMNLLTLQKLHSSTLTPELLQAWQPVPSPGSPEHLIFLLRHRAHCSRLMSLAEPLCERNDHTYGNCNASSHLAARRQGLIWFLDCSVTGNPIGVRLTKTMAAMMVIIAVRMSSSKEVFVCFVSVVCAMKCVKLAGTMI